MTPPHEILQRHLGPDIQLGPRAQAEADHDPARACALACLADIYGLNSKTEGMGLGLGAGFFKAAWGLDGQDDKGSSPDPFGNLMKTVMADVLEFKSPYPPHRT
jgi:hypothetical protein